MNNPMADMLAASHERMLEAAFDGGRALSTIEPLASSQLRAGIQAARDRMVIAEKSRNVTDLRAANVAVLHAIRLATREGLSVELP